MQCKLAVYCGFPDTAITPFLIEMGLNPIGMG